MINNHSHEVETLEINQNMGLQKVTTFPHTNPLNKLKTPRVDNQARGILTPVMDIISN